MARWIGAEPSQCGEEDPSSEYECLHVCDLLLGHEGDHSMTVTWPREATDG